MYVEIERNTCTAHWSTDRLFLVVCIRKRNFVNHFSHHALREPYEPEDRPKTLCAIIASAKPIVRCREAPGYALYAFTSKLRGRGHSIVQRN